MFSRLAHHNRAVESNIDRRAQWMPRTVESDKGLFDLRLGGRWPKISDVAAGLACT
jgi:hypothetical protein